MKIGKFELKNNLILAPMAGVSDVGFRALCVEMGADFAETEMVSAKAILYNNSKTLDLLNTTDAEKIKVVQLFGHEPEVFAKVCKSKVLDKFDIIDINMGCPAPKIVGNGDGSALMKNIDLSEKIIRACVKSTKKPIMVKIRKGFDEKSINAVEFAKMAELAGVSAITIHSRTREQYFGGNVDFDIIKDVVESVAIPVIANGDVVDIKSATEMLEKTGCAGLMIGRGAMGKPYIFREILCKGFDDNKLTYINKHIDILRRFYPDNLIVKEMKKHFLWYLKGEKNVKDLKNEILASDNLDYSINIITQYFTNK